MPCQSPWRNLKAACLQMVCRLKVSTCLGSSSGAAVRCDVGICIPPCNMDLRQTSVPEFETTTFRIRSRLWLAFS